MADNTKKTDAKTDQKDEKKAKDEAKEQELVRYDHLLSSVRYQSQHSLYLFFYVFSKFMILCSVIAFEIIVGGEWGRRKVTGHYLALDGINLSNLRST